MTSPSSPQGPPGAYRITDVPGQSAELSVSDFVGNTSFTIERNGDRCHITGIGSRDGIGVRFHQESGADPGIHGADAEQWRICGVPGTGFMAEPVIGDPPFAPLARTGGADVAETTGRT